MVTVYDVPADELIERLAEKLSEKESIVPPKWANWAKTGVHKERPPDDPNWWMIRTAAILRKVYLYGPIGTERMRGMFGGKKDRKSKPYKARKGSGSIARKALQQLEEAGLVSTIKGKGKVITPEGRSLLDNLSYEIMKEK
jgi:small subunit ribosomal protein S19e